MALRPHLRGGHPAGGHGFVLFAVEEAGKGSEEQQAKIDDALAALAEPRQEFLRERENGDVREGIDDANDVLVVPFADLVGGTDAWMQRVTRPCWACWSTASAGLMLANFLPKRQTEVGDWREATSGLSSQQSASASAFRGEGSAAVSPRCLWVSWIRRIGRRFGWPTRFIAVE